VAKNRFDIELLVLLLRISELGRFRSTDVEFTGAQLSSPYRRGFCRVTRR
jgi:hypothetical protein